MPDSPRPAGRQASSPEATLARLGFDVTQTVPALRRLGVWGEDDPRPELEPVVQALAASANPDASLAAFVRLVERNAAAWDDLVGGDDPSLVERAALIAGASEALADLFASDSLALEVLLGDLRPWSAGEIRRAVSGELAEAEDTARALATAQRRGLLRVAGRDVLGLAPTPDIAGELAELADGVLAAAFDHVARGLLADHDAPPRIAVIALGKLGGRELNYVSDVDVIFVAEGDWGAATKVCERFMRLCGTVTAEGRAYEVDANLRPEGRDGPLVRSLDAYKAYYERWAKTWEFQALLKARPLAGDAEVASSFLDLVEPHVWPNRLAPEAVEQIQKMKGVVESSKEVQRAGARQVKLGPGGLRDIEFAVQLLQLVHGRHDPSLRSGNTTAALAALAAGGYVDEQDAEQFRDAYAFLRTIEHRLQLARLRRTHTIPADDDSRRRLARAMGFRHDGQRDELQGFDAELRRIQRLTRRLHEKLFYRPLLSRFAELTADSVLPLAADRLDERAASDRLAALGFAHPERAFADIRALAEGVSRSAGLHRALLPALLPVFADSPNPDGGLSAFRSLAERLADSPSFLRTLRDNPPVGEALAQTLGASRLVGGWLERQPEVFGLLADLSGLQRTLDPSDYQRLADGLLRRRQDSEATADALRRMKRREVARTAVRDVAGLADVAATARELTGLAESCLAAALALALRDVDDSLRIAVIGLGKLGGGEVGYASDLDIQLVCSSQCDGQSAGRAAELLVKLLGGITPEGQAFQVDLGLRPEGKDGPLVRSIDATRTYYQRWAATWELQALTQARVVAGDAQIGAAFLELRDEVVYGEAADAGRLGEVRRMKARVERERAQPAVKPSPALRGVRTPARRPGQPARLGRPRAGRTEPQGARHGERHDVKLGPGGMADVEWTVQLLQLAHGADHPELRVPGTSAGIEAARALDLLTAEEARWFADGYAFLAGLRNAIYLAGERNSSVLPATPGQQEHIARMLGFPRPGSQALLEEVSRVTRRIRKVHERRFYDAGRS